MPQRHWLDDGACGTSQHGAGYIISLHFSWCLQMPQSVRRDPGTHLVFGGELFEPSNNSPPCFRHVNLDNQYLS